VPFTAKFLICRHVLYRQQPDRRTENKSGLRLSGLSASPWGDVSCHVSLGSEECGRSFGKGFSHLKIERSEGSKYVGIHHNWLQRALTKQPKLCWVFLRLNSDEKWSWNVIVVLICHTHPGSTQVLGVIHFEQVRKATTRNDIKQLLLPKKRTQQLTSNTTQREIKHAMGYNKVSNRYVSDYLHNIIFSSRRNQQKTIE